MNQSSKKKIKPKRGNEKAINLIVKPLYKKESTTKIYGEKCYEVLGNLVFQVGNVKSFLLSKC